jgi:hypothetical protein
VSENRPLIFGMPVYVNAAVPQDVVFVRTDGDIKRLINLANAEKEIAQAHAAGFRAGVEACIKHLRENCAGTWSVNDVANELAAMKEKMDAVP